MTAMTRLRAARSTCCMVARSPDRCDLSADGTGNRVVTEGSAPMGAQQAALLFFMVAIPPAIRSFPSQTRSLVSCDAASFVLLLAMSGGALRGVISFLLLVI